MWNLDFYPFFSMFKKVWVLGCHNVGNFMSSWDSFVTPCPRSGKLVSYGFHAWDLILFSLIFDLACLQDMHWTCMSNKQRFLWCFRTETAFKKVWVLRLKDLKLKPLICLVWFPWHDMLIITTWRRTISWLFSLNAVMTWLRSGHNMTIN